MRWWIMFGVMCFGWIGYAPVFAQPTPSEETSDGKAKPRKKNARNKPTNARKRKKATPPRKAPVPPAESDEDPSSEEEKSGDKKTPPLSPSESQKDDPTASDGAASPKDPKKALATLLTRRAKVFLFLSPIETDKASIQGASALGSVLVELAKSRLSQLEAVRLKTFLDMPAVTQVMARFGNLEQLDRVSLIAIKNITGFDGIIRTQYRMDARGVALTMTYIDFRNGKIFRKRHIKQALSAELFQIVEKDMIEFATLIRRSYRVTLRVQSIPTAANVTIDGKYVGKTPILLELRTGQRQIEVSANGFQTYETSMFLKAGDQLLLRAALPKALVSFLVTSEPKGSRVFVNNRLVGVTPLQHLIPVGQHRISVVKEGYKPFQTNVTLRPGDRLQLHVPLYNPLAARFLNAKPGFLLDTRQIHFGYRYVYLGIPYPNMRDINFIDFSFLMRMYWFELGFRFSPSIGIDSTNKLKTFVGEEEGIQRFSLNVIQIHAVAKYALFEKYSFATIHLGASLGMSLVKVKSAVDDELFRVTFSAEAFASFVSRLFRSGNFSMELQFDIGFTYLGQLAYKERTFNIFGKALEEEKDRPMYGPYGALTLRMVFWNGIF